MNNIARQRQHYDEVATSVEDYAEFYSFLDKHMSYSCNLWEDEGWAAQTNGEATVFKWEQYADLLELKEGMTVLVVGSGFGHMEKYLTKHYGVKVTSLNVSEEQYKYYTQDCEGVDFKLQSWETLYGGNYDVGISEGVMVHQSDKREFFKFFKFHTKKFLIREMHLTNGTQLTKEECKNLNFTYGFSGSYCHTQESLDNIKDLGLKVTTSYWDIENYIKTQKGWLFEMDKNKKRMMEINEKAYKDRDFNFNLFLNGFFDGWFEMPLFLCEV